LLLAGEARSFERNTPGEFDYYVLVLSWSPSYCRTEGRKDEVQCDATRPHAFVLHGLWPQYEKGWPENCRTETRPWVPQAVINEMRDIMPSKSLIIHQYRDHGTCSGLGPAQYFAVARELYERIDVPARLESPAAGLLVTPDEVEREFLAANPWLTPDMMSVTCRGANLLDVRICFDRDLYPRSCGANEDQKRLCRAAKITVPPARAH
jgi:ribonuclease T2